VALRSGRPTYAFQGLYRSVQLAAFILEFLDYFVNVHRLILASENVYWLGRPYFYQNRHTIDKESLKETRNKKNKRKASKPIRRITQAPPPATEVGGRGWVRSTQRPIEVPHQRIKAFLS
jgi:hypothetical protein